MGVTAALVVHPGSGHGAAARVAGSIAARLRQALDRLDVYAANTPEQAREALRTAFRDGVDVLVVAGGDGAVHQAVQWCAGTGTALGVVACGTGNDLARALRLPTGPEDCVEEIVSALRQGNRRHLDLGFASDDRAGDGGGRWFSTVLCAGFDARVNERANTLRRPRGARRYDVAILRELAGLWARPLVVRTEHEHLELDATLVAVGNTTYYGGGIPVCPAADPGDGLFDVTVVGRVARHELARILPRLRGGTHPDHPAVRTLRARSITLTGNDWPVYADGEPLGTLPATVRCSPRRLRVLSTG